jgi:hypothetical protein
MIAPPAPPKPYVSNASNVPSFANAPRRVSTERQRMRLPRFGWRYAVGAVVVLAVLYGGYSIYVNIWTKSPFGPTQADAAQAAETTPSANMSEAEIIAAVGKIMLLPNDETPTLAKVSDPSVLQSQAFFKNAAVGDIVLMYSKSSRAIIYDPMQNKIIEVGPITGSSASTTAASTSTVAK